jgi:N,N-dimethylformamidase beta subunit-like protein/Big-like domain-containing protein
MRLMKVAIIATIIIFIIIGVGSYNINNTILVFASRSPSDDKEKEEKLVDMEDNVRPMIKIIDPSPQSTITLSEITINGTASDSGSGIQKVEVLVHIYPFDNIFNYQEADPISTNGDWSKWSITLPISTVGVYRIQAHAIDNAGNENWDEVRIGVPFLADSSLSTFSDLDVPQILPSSPPPPASASPSASSMKKIALVIPTFTEAAYLPDSFYTFYNKYYSIPSGKNVTTDLGLLSVPILYRFINSSTAVNMETLSKIDQPSDPDKIILTLAEHLKRTKSGSLITIIRDEDIHNGYIFNSGVASDNSKNNSNNYDTLVIFHDEYATQSMYNNYKRFVSNGGTIIFVDANVFIAEVDYNKNNHKITLVKGHNWEFDGKSAAKGVGERWFNENKEWVGSNFLVSGLRDKISFLNNHFNYTHFEENYVNNPQNKILIDYDVVVPKNSVYTGFRVASYELSYGKGKVIMTGLYGQNLISNKSFLKMLDSWILN